MNYIYDNLNIYIMERNDIYLFFYSPNPHSVGFKSCLSDWYNSRFESDGIVFFTIQQWLMYKKAILFKDYYRAYQILDKKLPYITRGLGKKVENFDEEVWLKKKYELLFDGCYLKFTQNIRIMKYLVSTDPLILVNTSVDENWGVGYSDIDIKYVHKDKWGKNLFGKVLIDVRKTIIKDKLLYTKRK